MKKIWIIIIVLLVAQWNLLGQSGILDKEISVNYQYVTLKEALEDLAGRFDLHLSYSSDIVSLQKRVTLAFEKKSLKTVLSRMLSGSGINYVLVGDQLVLKKVEVKKLRTKQPSVKTIQSDKVKTDSSEHSSSRFFKEDEFPVIEDISHLQKVYEESQSRIYDEYFKVQDTTHSESGKTLKKELKRALRNLRRKVNRLADSLRVETERLKVKENRFNLQRDTSLEASSDSSGDEDGDILKRPAQVSFIYPLGTNGVESYRYSNSFSLNILAGYAGGLEGFEVASFSNLEKSDVKGFQAAGLTNISGGALKGVQVAGLTNVARERSTGLQAAGLINLVSDTANIFQSGGLVNIVAGRNFGAQFAGLANVTSGSMIGPQASGFINIASGYTRGVQIAGFSNVTVKAIDGIQISGFLNYARQCYGAQIGFINKSGNVKGSQIGFLNIADSVGGVQIGFLSIARKGYRRLELSGSESIHSSLTFKTGTSAFYNILTVGLRQAKSQLWWSYGYGVGTELKLAPRLPLNIELVAHQINRMGYGTEYLNMLNRVKVTVGFQLKKHLTLFAGPVWNVQLAHIPHSEYNTFSIAPYSIYKWKSDFITPNGNQTFLNSWIGGTVGIRF